MEEIKYWLCICSAENYTECKKKLLWGVHEEKINNLRSTKLGDILLFYIAMRRTWSDRQIQSGYFFMGGIYEVMSGVMLTPNGVLWSNECPHCVKIKTKHELNEGKITLEDLSFILNQPKISLYVNINDDMIEITQNQFSKLVGGV